MKVTCFTWLWVLAASLPVTAEMTPEQVASLPPPAAHPINFTTEIKPIFETGCIKCHGRGQSKGGFRLDNRATLLEGGDSGPAVVPGKSAGSYLIELVAAIDPDNVMPLKGSRLNARQVGLLRAWIDQGAAWDEAVSFAKQPPRHLTPRQPSVPPARAAFNLDHPVDRFIDAYFQAHGRAWPEPVEDRVFIRRVYLDVIGLLPEPEAVAAFVKDHQPDKRIRLVRQLLQDNARYAEHWLTFWNDLLRNDYRGTGYIDGGRKQITGWLYNALLLNLPYNQFVGGLINPTPEAEGFVKGIVWRGVVNASQTPPMQAAQNISQVFMGVNLKCASCHDSFINDWTLADAYGLANIYSEEPLELFQCDKPTGKKAGMRFIYPQLGEIEAAAKKPERLRQLAKLVTDKSDGRLPRTMVNRLWAKLYGRGLVEPLEDMEQGAWHEDLLDWLAEDLVASGWDLKHTLERMLTSRAYQLPAVAAAERQAGAEFVFAGPLVRRLSAEQFRDAVGQLTGVWYAQPEGEFDFSQRHLPGSAVDIPAVARWIWNDAEAARKTAPGTVYFRKTFSLDKVPDVAVAMAAGDNRFTLYLNGREITSGQDFKKPQLVDLRPHLQAGTNILAAKVVNNLPDNSAPPTDKPIPPEAANPAGFIFQARLGNIAGEAALEQNSELQVFNLREVIDLGSDASWICRAPTQNDWTRLDFGAAEWRPAMELGPADMGPWELKTNLRHSLVVKAMRDRVRAALVAADALQVGLGRPNREQVMVARASQATTLQALELTNGETLARLLRRGAANLLASQPEPGPLFAESLFERALGRKPSSQEQTLAKEALGDPIKPEGVEDLLWSLAMLPEFQLIY